MKLKTYKFLTLLLSISVVSIQGINAQKSTWQAPAESKTITNPLKKDTQSTDKGKALYVQMCSICHGEKGKGDGAAGAGMNPVPTNFTKEMFQSQTDGEIYWKITFGKGPMAAYKGSLTDEQRWQLVEYLRGFRANKD